MNCDCPICKGRNINKEGIMLAESTVIPFVKNVILKLQYPKHPFPRKYISFYYSLLAYSQALAYSRAHNEPVNKYYTDNTFMLKFSSILNNKFPELIITDISNMSNENVREVCEFNVD